MQGEIGDSQASANIVIPTQTPNLTIQIPQQQLSIQSHKSSSTQGETRGYFFC